MKTNKYQWMKDLHLMTFVFVCLGILYLLIFVFLCRIPICILSVFVIIIIIFFALQPCYSWERRKEKSDHLEFIMMMVIFSCSSRGWLKFLAFLGYLRFWMGNIKEAGWNGLKILIPKHMRKSKIGLLEQIWAQNPYDTFFWVTLYFMVNYYWHFHATFSAWFQIYQYWEGSF